MKHLESIINCGLFDEIDSSDYIRVLENLNFSSRNFVKNETIFFEGDLIDKICLIEKGSVRSEKTFNNGEVHIVDIFDEGSIFALSVAVSRTKASALDFVSNVDSTVLFISMNSVKKSYRSPELRQALMYRLADDNIKMSHKIEILAERGLRDRILIYLNILSSKSNSNMLTLRLNREQLAQYLCVNRSALSNELNKMRKEGIIDFDKNRFIILKDTPFSKRDRKPVNIRSMQVD